MIIRFDKMKFFLDLFIMNGYLIGKVYGVVIVFVFFEYFVFFSGGLEKFFERFVCFK